MKKKNLRTHLEFSSNTISVVMFAYDETTDDYDEQTI